MNKLKTHWRTTLSGFAVAVILPLIDIINASEVSVKTMVLSAASLLIGWLAKDKDAQ